MNGLDVFCLIEYSEGDINDKEANEFYLYKPNAYMTKTIFKVTEIGYDAEGKINKLTIEDHKGNKRFGIISEEEQREILKCMTELSNLLEETDIDREKFYSYYNVSSNAEMTLKQLKDAIRKLKKKLEK